MHAGIVASDGALWQEQRRFVLKAFHDLGVGRAAVELTICDELREFIADVEEYGIAFAYHYTTVYCCT